MYKETFFTSFSCVFMRMYDSSTSHCNEKLIFLHGKVVFYVLKRRKSYFTKKADPKKVIQYLLNLNTTLFIDFHCKNILFVIANEVKEYI